MIDLNECKCSGSQYMRMVAKKEEKCNKLPKEWSKWTVKKKIKYIDSLEEKK